VDREPPNNLLLGGFTSGQVGAIPGSIGSPNWHPRRNCEEREPVNGSKLKAMGYEIRASAVASSVILGRQKAGRLRWGLLLVVCCGAILVSFRQTLLLLLDTWYRSRTYSHCFLILPLFFFLIWIRRKSVADLKPLPNYWGLPLLCVLTFVWIMGNLGEVRVVQEFAVISIFIALVWTLMGTAFVRALAFPLLFLYFAVPFGTSLVRPLQEFTAWFVIHALTISNVPAVLDNHAISLPSSVWTVAEACSGIRFLLSSVVLGTFFSFLVYQSRWRRLLFICASIIVPIVGNGLRAYGTILLAYSTNNKLAAGLDHIVYGGVFSVFLQMVLMLVGLRWRENPAPIPQVGPNCKGAALAAEANRMPDSCAMFASAAALALVVLAPILAAYLWNRSSATTEWPNPPVIVTGPWQAAATGDTSWALEWNGSEREFGQRYEADTRRVDLYWVMYSGREAMNWPTTSDGTDGSRSWTMASDTFENVIVDGQQVKAERRVIESGAESRAVWTWYWVSGEYTASRVRVRLLQAKARLLEKPATVAVINLGTGNERDATEVERTLQNFLLHASFRTRSGATAPI
jgi:exosortase A